MSRPRTFPPEIYITVEEPGLEDEYFQVHVSTETAAVIGKERRVGRYMLHEVVKVKTKIDVSGT